VPEQTLIDEDGCYVSYIDGYVPVDQLKALEEECLATQPFQPMLRFKTVEVPQPRLISWLADDAALTYTYTGVFLEPKPMPPMIAALAKQLGEDTGRKFPTCLLNLYRDGNDSVSWHSDNEKELGANSTIAAISMGAVRTFQLKHKRERPNRIVSIQLQPGSLLLMAGRTQSVWAHQIPKESGAPGQRISLTFRPHVRASR
jgi:alkylated DNA repair dioxygenase AlkB